MDKYLELKKLKAEVEEKNRAVARATYEFKVVAAKWVEALQGVSEVGAEEASRLKVEVAKLKLTVARENVAIAEIDAGRGASPARLEHLAHIEVAEKRIAEIEAALEFKTPVYKPGLGIEVCTIESRPLSQ